MELIMPDTTNIEDLEVLKGKKKIKRGISYNLPDNTANLRASQKLVNTLIKNMYGHITKRQKAYVLLVGDVGIGKTSRLRFVQKVLGMNLIIIEAPSVGEDDLIEIPFLVVTGKKEERNVYGLKHAESTMVTRLRAMKHKTVSDSIWKKMLAGSPNAKKVHNSLANPRSGSSNIDKVRVDFNSGVVGNDDERYNTILFIDEFYRSGSTNIQNILRNILNGKIGNTEIPSYVYIVFASNILDNEGTLDEIAGNNDFHAIDIDDEVTAASTLSAIADSTGSNNEAIDGDTIDANAIDPEIFNMFSAIVADDDFERDEDLEIDTEAPSRISPRRLSFMMEYFDKNNPIQNEEHARSMVLYLRTQFRDYQSGNLSELYGKYRKVLEKMLESAPIEASTDPKAITKFVDSVKDTSWHTLLDQKLNTIERYKDGNYQPLILSSLPGMGKTTAVRNFVGAKKWALLEKDVSTLSDDDVKGVSLLDESSNSEGKPVSRSEDPALYIEIREAVEKAKAQGAPKLLILFDEFSRPANQKVFNAVRQILLDKSILGKKLDEGWEGNVIIMGALNPNDVGTVPLSMHVSDTLDILAIHNDIKVVFEDHILQDPHITLMEDEHGIKLTQYFTEFFYTFLESGKLTAEDLEEKKLPNYHLRLFTDPDEEPYYFSPRNYTDIFVSTVNNLLLAMDGDDPEESIREGLVDAFHKVFQMTLIREKMGRSEKREKLAFLKNHITGILNGMTLDTKNSILVTIDLANAVRILQEDLKTSVEDKATLFGAFNNAWQEVLDTKGYVEQVVQTPSILSVVQQSLEILLEIILDHMFEEDALNQLLILRTVIDRLIAASNDPEVTDGLRLLYDNFWDTLNSEV